MSKNGENNDELRLPWNMSSSTSMQQDMDRLPTVGFFTQLPEREGNFTFAEFQRYWNDLDKYDFEADQLTTIISKTAAALNALDEGDLKKNCLSELYFRFTSWEDQAVRKVPQFSQPDLALSLWSHRMLDLNPRDDILEAWYEYARPIEILQGDPDERKIVRSIASCAEADLIPSESFFKFWTPKALRHIPEFTPLQLRDTLWSYARFAREPEKEILDAWVARFKTLHNSKTLKDGDYANILGSCGALHAITGNPVFKDIARTANDTVNIKRFGYPKMRQVVHARLWFDFDLDGAKLPPSDERPSNIEKRLGGAFKKAALNPNAYDATITELGVKPDFAFDLENKEILIEADGPHHFLMEINEIDGSRQAAGFTGRTLYISALIRKFAINAVLLRMPQPVIETVLNQDPADRSKLLTNLIKNAYDQDPGVYHTRLRRSVPYGGIVHDDLLIRPAKLAPWPQPET